MSGKQQSRVGGSSEIGYFFSDDGELVVIVTFPIEGKQCHESTEILGELNADCESYFAQAFGLPPFLIRAKVLAAHERRAAELALKRKEAAYTRPPEGGDVSLG